MQLSRFTIAVEDYPGPGEHLVFNTRTQALVKVDEVLKDILASFDLGENGSRKFTAPSRRLSREDYERHGQDLKALFEMGILVKDEADEAGRFERFIEQRKYGVDPANFTVSILTTYSCNFACTYCFEETTRTSGQRLSQVTSDEIMAWMKSKLEKLNPKQLTLNFYGGEPLLNQHAIEHVSAHMQEWCEARGIHYKMMLQTNGALLTPELVQKYKKLGLEFVQVSLDGTREVHDRQRPMRGSGKGTFDTVIKNVIAAVDHIKVTIAAGYDEGDPSGILALLDYLEEVGVLHKLENFVYSPIHPTLGPKDRPGDIVGSSCLKNFETHVLMNATRIIKDAMRSKGLKVGSGLSTSMCPLTRNEGGVTVDTNGLIFKCNSMLGHPELAVGSVREDEYNTLFKDLMATDNWKKCDSDCPYAPICNMGCRLHAFFKAGDWAARSCERSYMDAFIPQAVKAEYDRRVQEVGKKVEPAEACT